MAVNMEAFQTARDEYIEQLIAILDEKQLVNILSKESNNPKIKNGVYITSLAKFALSCPVNDSQKYRLDQAARKLDDIAIRFHKIQSNKPIMTLHIVETDANNQQSLIYYTTKNMQSHQRELRGVLCDNKGCSFQSFEEEDVKNLDNTTKIKLASKYKASSRHESKTLSDDKVELLGMHLEKTGEWFGNAEIVVVISFFNADDFLQEHTVFLPWAIKKGYNQNLRNSPFFSWPENATKALAVIIEDDTDSTYFDILRQASKLIKIFGSVGTTIADIADRVIDKVEKWVREDDYIGTAIFEREDNSKVLETVEKTATFYLKRPHF